MMYGPVQISMFFFLLNFDNTSIFFLWFLKPCLVIPMLHKQVYLHKYTENSGVVSVIHYTAAHFEPFLILDICMTSLLAIMRLLPGWDVSVREMKVLFIRMSESYVDSVAWKFLGDKIMKIITKNFTELPKEAVLLLTQLKRKIATTAQEG